MTTAVASAPILPQLEGANLLNLMIVDDERAIREACREVAQSLGFNTCVADSAEHSYRMLDAQGVDVVLLDLKLPGAGGLEALHQIRERRADAVVIVVTGYGTVQSAVQASDLPSAIHSVQSTMPSGGNGAAKIVPIADLEKQTIISTIGQLNGDKPLAAKLLGIGKTTLYRKLKEYAAQD